MRQRNFTNIFLLMVEEEEEREPTRKEKERQ
jgi:hypothetical protein